MDPGLHWYRLEMQSPSQAQGGHQQLIPKAEGKAMQALVFPKRALEDMEAFQGSWIGAQGLLWEGEMAQIGNSTPCTQRRKTCMRLSGTPYATH